MATPRRVRSLRRSLVYGVAIAPLGLVSVVTVFGDPLGTVRRWGQLATRTGAARRARGGGDGQGRRPAAPAVLGHAVMSVLLGLLAWVLVLVILLMVARGALYGVVDRGPYDNAWGGPSLAGAWLVHFALSIPVVVLAAELTKGVTHLHLRLTGRLHGVATPGWVLPVALLLCAAGALFVFAWTRQL